MIPDFQGVYRLVLAFKNHLESNRMEETCFSMSGLLLTDLKHNTHGRMLKNSLRRDACDMTSV